MLSEATSETAFFCCSLCPPLVPEPNYCNPTDGRGATVATICTAKYYPWGLRLPGPTTVLLQIRTVLAKLLSCWMGSKEAVARGAGGRLPLACCYFATRRVKITVLLSAAHRPSIDVSHL